MIINAPYELCHLIKMQLKQQLYLTHDETKRYDRHLRLAGFGPEKQMRLKQSKVLLLGAGGLGCPIGLYLAASGVGIIGIADDDRVDIANLQRQVAFLTDDVGNPKAKVLAQRLSALNPLLQIVDHSFRIDAANVEDLITNYDLVVDGTDNFATRFLLADACFINRISYLHASVYQYEGQVSLFVPGKTPCFRCLFRQPPDASALPACNEAGILGVVTGTIGLIAVTEVIKYLTNLGDSLAGKVLLYNGLTQESKIVHIQYDENCPLCSRNATINKIETQNDYAICRRQELSERVTTVDEAKQWIENDKELYLMDVREPKEYEEGHIDNAVLVPLSALKSLAATPEQNHYLAKLPVKKEQKILCYCRRGSRSLQAVDILHEAGFINAFSMDGGFESWINNQTD